MIIIIETYQYVKIYLFVTSYVDNLKTLKYLSIYVFIEDHDSKDWNIWIILLF